MTDHQIVMFALGAVPILWGILAAFRGWRKSARERKEKQPNIVATGHGSYCRANCKSCGSDLGNWEFFRPRKRLCGECGNWWARIGGVDVAYRHRRPTMAELAAFARAKRGSGE